MMMPQRHHGIRASFVISVTSAFVACICYIVSFVTPYWIVAKTGDNLGFQRFGLWEVCFHNFIFPEDYVSKAYKGCWYIYYPEYKYIRFWLNPAWLYALQMLSIIGLICSMTGLLFIILILCEIYGTRERNPKITVIILESITLSCLIITTITMGTMSRDRQWLPRADHNRVSWSFGLAVISGFSTILCLFGLGTHFLSVESRIMMEDPVLQEKLLTQEFKPGYSKSVSGFGTGYGTESKFGGTAIPSLFTVPGAPGSQFGPSSTMIPPGSSSAFGRSTIAPGAVGTAAHGTSAANVSAKLRQTLEAQKAAVQAANARAADSEPTGPTGQSSSTYGQYPHRTDMNAPGGVPQHEYNSSGRQGSQTHLHPVVMMDSTV